MSRRVEFGAMGSIYAIAGDVVEPSIAFLDRILWMLDSVNLPSLLTVGCLVSAFHLGLWYRSMQSPVRLSNYPVIHSCFSFCCSHASNIHISSFEWFWKWVAPHYFEVCAPLIVNDRSMSISMSLLTKKSFPFCWSLGSFDCQYRINVDFNEFTDESIFFILSQSCENCSYQLSENGLHHIVLESWLPWFFL